MRKVTGRNKLIPETAAFTCENCGTAFISDEFEISALRVTDRELPRKLLQTYRIRICHDYYSLSEECPVCRRMTHVHIDKGEPDYEVKEPAFTSE